MLTHQDLTAKMTTYADALMAESLEYEKARNRQAILRSRLSKEGEDDHKNLENIKKIDTKIQKLIRSSQPYGKTSKPQQTKKHCRPSQRKQQI